jgi:hypothetical protein
MTECIPYLVKAGIKATDAYALRRIAITLRKWFELECGSDFGAIERDETTGEVSWYDSKTGQRWPYPDRETPALKRLATIMARYPTLGYYIQGDCRGASLYILRPGDIPEGKNAESYYNNGVAVYK